MSLCQTAVCCPYVCNPHEIFAKNCNNFHGVNSIKLCISRVHRQKEKDFKFFLEVLFVIAHRFCCPCALLYIARKGMYARETLAGFPLHVKSPARRRPILRSKNACSKKPPLAAAPSGASQAFCRRQDLGAGGIHFRRAVLIPLGWSDQGERNPKIKDRQRRSFIFGAGYGNRTRLLGLGSRCTTDVLTLRSEAIIAENFVHCNRKMPFGMIFLFYA